MFFYSEQENYIYSNQDYKPVNNSSGFSNNDIILTNIYLNDTQNVEITIKNKKEEDESQNKTYHFFTVRKTSSGLSTTGIVLISVLVPLI